MADPYDDFDRRAEEDYRWEMRRPKCAYCHRHITWTDRSYEFDNEDIVCPDCLEDYLMQNQDIMLELAVERADDCYEICVTDKEEGND